MDTVTIDTSRIKNLKRLSDDGDYLDVVTKLSTNINNCKEFDREFRQEETLIALIELFLEITKYFYVHENKKYKPYRQAYEVYEWLYSNVRKLGGQLIGNLPEMSSSEWKKKVKDVLDNGFFKNNKVYKMKYLDAKCFTGASLISKYKDVYCNVKKKDFTRRTAFVLIATIDYLMGTVRENDE